MTARLLRPLAALALLVGFAIPFAAPNEAAAAGRNEIISRGVYDGKWHGDKVTFSVEKVERDGCFSGVVHFDAHSNWPDAKFDFTGQIGKGGSLTIRRVKDGCDQVARAGTPRVNGKCWDWAGDVTGDGLDRAYPFELHVPR
jgi:hypothetical protein